MRRFLIFLLYDPDGFVDNAVIHTLRGLRPHVETMFVVSNGFLQPDSRQRLEAEVDEVFERQNTGFDVGAYRSALGKIGYERLNDYDELLLINYTFFGPVTSFDELFERMDAKQLDFWGLTSHVEMTPHPIVGKGTMPEHLQSYWIGFRKSLFATGDFRSYWSSLPDAHSYHDVITIFETELTEHFANLGYGWEAAFPNEKYEVANVSMEAPIELMDDGCPMFKRRLYFHDVSDLDQRDVSGYEVTKYAIEHGFPRDILIDGIIRRTSARSLATGLGLQIIHPGDFDADAESDLRTVTIKTPIWKQLVTDREPVEGSDIVFVESPSPEWKTPEDEAEFDSWHRRKRRHARAVAAVLRHQNSIVNAFAGDPRLGAVMPLTDHRGTSALGAGWCGRRGEAQRLANLLHLQGPLERNSPLAPGMGIFAVRLAAIAGISERIRRAGGWNVLAAEFGGDEGLEELLNLLVADIARTNGFVTAEAATFEDFRTSAVLLQQKYADVASRFAPTPPAPFHEGLKNPGGPLRSRIGATIRAKSPRTAKAILGAERIAKSALGNVRKRSEMGFEMQGSEFSSLEVDAAATTGGDTPTSSSPLTGEISLDDIAAGQLNQSEAKEL